MSQSDLWHLQKISVGPQSALWRFNQATIQTDQYFLRKLIKRWNVTKSMGLAPVNIFKTINVSCPILSVSVFLACEQARLRGAQQIYRRLLFSVKTHGHSLEVRSREKLEGGVWVWWGC